MNTYYCCICKERLVRLEQDGWKDVYICCTCEKVYEIIYQDLMSGTSTDFIIIHRFCDVVELRRGIKKRDRIKKI
jgi:hypothetical protein